MEAMQKRIQLPPTLSDGLIYDKTNFSALQVTTSRGVHRQVIVNDVQSVIDNTSTMTTWVKGYQLSIIRIQWRPEWSVISYQQYEYNDDLSEELPVINNTTNLSEGLPVINNTSAKMTYVVAGLCGL